MQLLSQVDAMGQKIQLLETVNEQLAHEIAILKRHKFAKRSEHQSPDQGSLLDDLLALAHRIQLVTEEIE